MMNENCKSIILIGDGTCFFALRETSDGSLTLTISPALKKRILLCAEHAINTLIDKYASRRALE